MQEDISQKIFSAATKKTYFKVEMLMASKIKLAILDNLQWKGSMSGNTSLPQTIRKKVTHQYRYYFISENLIVLFKDSPNMSAQIIKTSSELRSLKTEF